MELKQIERLTDKLIKKEHGINNIAPCTVDYGNYLEKKLEDRDIAKLIKHYSSEKPTGILFFDRVVHVYLGSANLGLVPPMPGCKNTFYSFEKDGLQYFGYDRLKGFFWKLGIDIDKQDEKFKLNLNKLRIAEDLESVGEKALAQDIKSRYLRQLK